MLYELNPAVVVWIGHFLHRLDV